MLFPDREFNGLLRFLLEEMDHADEDIYPRACLTRAPHLPGRRGEARDPVSVRAVW
jgi:hypothetical protein